MVFVEGKPELPSLRMAVFFSREKGRNGKEGKTGKGGAELRGKGVASCPKERLLQTLFGSAELAPFLCSNSPPPFEQYLSGC